MRPRTQLHPSTCSRVFLAPRWLSTTPSRLAEVEQIEPTQRRNRAALAAHKLKHLISPTAQIPEYPYGQRHLFQQSNRGLYGNAQIQFGNNVSKDTETKTRRHWKPNILSKSIFSIALQKKVKLRVAASVLRTIDKEGGLDEYILASKESRIKELGPEGWRLRWLLMQQPAIKQRLVEEAKALGLSEDVIRARWDDRKTQEQLDEEYRARVWKRTPRAEKRKTKSKVWKQRKDSGSDSVEAGSVLIEDGN